MADLPPSLPPVPEIQERWRHLAALEKDHYERIHSDYARHYYDQTSMAYRRRFIYDHLLAGLDLNGKRVADLACGSGYTSLELQSRYPGVHLCGFDISERACADYRRLTGSTADVCDLASPLPSDIPPFDVALVVGGLHHCAGHLDRVLDNVATLLAPGGVFLIFEPNGHFFLEAVRRLWYRMDGYFVEETELALNHDDMLHRHQAQFRLRALRHMGGPAYFLILNSLVLRVPSGIKPILWPLLRPLEEIYNCLPGRLPFPYFIAQWDRTGEAITA